MLEQQDSSEMQSRGHANRWHEGTMGGVGIRLNTLARAGLMGWLVLGAATTTDVAIKIIRATRIVIAA